MTDYERFMTRAIVVIAEQLNAIRLAVSTSLQIGPGDEKSGEVARLATLAAKLVGTTSDAPMGAPADKADQDQHR